MTMLAENKLPGLLSWMGAKIEMAPKIIEQLGTHNYYLEALAGSMAVLMAKSPSSSEIVCDLHGGLTNLAWVIADEPCAVELYSRLVRTLNSSGIHSVSQNWCKEFEESREDKKGKRLDWAYHYFVASMQSRNGVCGSRTGNTTHQVRYTNKGGNSASRFAARVETIPEWHQRLRNVQILRKSCFDVLPKVDDAEGIAIYADPPYLDGTASAKYFHGFAPADHRRLADQLRRFKKSRVVVSYYDSPELDHLYSGWTKIDCATLKRLSTQNRKGSKRVEAMEVLLVNGEAFGVCHELF